MEALKASALSDFSSMDMEGRAVLGHAARREKLEGQRST